MILTVTLNPAVDKIIILDNFKLGKLNRVNDTTILAGVDILPARSQSSQTRIP